MVRPYNTPKRYLCLNLDGCGQILPDWLMVFCEIARQVRVQKIGPGGELELRSPIWSSAGVETLDRRKKILAHLEAKVPPQMLRFSRRKGRSPIAVIGVNFEDCLSGAQTLPGAVYVQPSQNLRPA
jgi:hypothetical protein